MRWDALLEWMTHLGSGRWGMFRDGVAELSGSKDLELQNLCRTIRVALSDLGHADFFIDGTRRWRIRKPALLGLRPCSGLAVLGGGRTRLLVDAVAAAARASGLAVSATDAGVGLTQVRITGRELDLSEVAAAADIEYVPNAAALVASQIIPIRNALDNAPVQEEPLNWSVRSWSFATMGWTEGRLPKTAREYSNRHGVRRYMVEVRRGRLCQIDKREAIFAAALIRRARLASYRASEQVLDVPLAAPLPDLYARAAYLASGRTSTVSNGRLLFEAIPPEAAAVLLVSLGQRHPLEEDLR